MIVAVKVAHDMSSGRRALTTLVAVSTAVEEQQAAPTSPTSSAPHVTRTRRAERLRRSRTRNKTRDFEALWLLFLLSSASTQPPRYESPLTMPMNEKLAAGVEEPPLLHTLANFDSLKTAGLVTR